MRYPDALPQVNMRFSKGYLTILISASHREFLLILVTSSSENTAVLTEDNWRTLAGRIGQRKFEVQQLAPRRGLRYTRNVEFGGRAMAGLKIEKTAGRLSWRDHFRGKSAPLNFPGVERIFAA